MFQTWGVVSKIIEKEIESQETMIDMDRNNCHLTLLTGTEFSAILAECSFFLSCCFSDRESENSDTSDSDFEPEKEVTFSTLSGM